MVCICFPGSTTVITKQGGVKRMDQVKPGDDILTSSRKQGTRKFTQFYTWGHRESNAMAEFLVLSMNNGKQLEISREHLIFVADGNNKERKIAKTAGQVCIGDKLFHLGEQGSSMELLSVTEITTEMITGVYAPFTMSGHFLADGILVGCYGDIANFELAHSFFAPLRAWFRLRQLSSSSKKGENINQDGIHGYARQLMKMRDALPSSLRNYVN